MDRYENKTLVSPIRTEEDLIRISGEDILALLGGIESPRVSNVGKEGIVNILSARNWIRGANLAREVKSQKEFAINLYEKVFSEYFGLYKTKKAALEGARFAIESNSTRLSKEDIAPENLLKNLEGYLPRSEIDSLKQIF